MRKLNHALLASALALACASCTAEKEANYQVIPLPQEVSLTQGNPFKLNEKCSHRLSGKQCLIATQC